MPRTKKNSRGLVAEIDCNEPLNVSLTDSEIYDLKTEFVWFFNGHNNAQTLLAQRNNRFLDVLYSRYCSEISKMREHYGLDEIISESEYAHGWFKNWKTMELFTKDQFLEKAKFDNDFSLIWADLGTTDALEFRNWGLAVKFESDDEASVKNAGTDQLTELINSIISNPEKGVHFATLYNPENLKERTIPIDLVSVQFVCEKLSYGERVDWFLLNYFETGMERDEVHKNLKNEDLDKFKWYDDFISFPKYNISLYAYYGIIENEIRLDRTLVFNTMFLKTMASILNMVPHKLFIISPQNECLKRKIGKEKVYISANRKNSKGIQLSHENIGFERHTQ